MISREGEREPGLHFDTNRHGKLCYWSCLFESPNDLLAASQALIAMGGPPFNRCDNIGERDLFGRTGKAVSAGCTSLGLDKAAAN